MIIEYYPGPTPKAKPPKPVNEPTYHQSYWDFQAKRKGIDVAEFKRRDGIVRAQMADCNFYIGEKVYPYNQASYLKYGMVRIKGIYRTYAEFDDNDTWPDNDVVFPVLAVPLDDNKGDAFLATVRFFSKTPPV